MAADDENDDARALDELERATSTERQPGEVVVLTLFLAVGVFFLIGALGYPFLSDDGLVGPGTVPLIVSGLYIVVMAVALVRSIRAGAAGPAGAPSPSRRSAAREGLRAFGINRDLLIVVGVLGASLLLVPVLGLVPGLAVTSFLCSWWVGRKRWWTSLIVTVIAAIAIQLIFVNLLRVPLPAPLDFL